MTITYILTVFDEKIHLLQLIAQEHFLKTNHQISVEYEPKYQVSCGATPTDILADSIAAAPFNQIQVN